MGAIPFARGELIILISVLSGIVIIIGLSIFLGIFLTRKQRALRRATETPEDKAKRKQKVAMNLWGYGGALLLLCFLRDHIVSSDTPEEAFQNNVTGFVLAAIAMTLFAIATIIQIKYRSPKQESEDIDDLEDIE